MAYAKKQCRLTFTEGGKPRCMIIEYGLTQHGDQTPYFSITATVYRNGNFNTSDRFFDRGGCLHEDILKRKGKTFGPLVKFHLRDIDGAPMYPLENGLYWAEGAVGLQKMHNDITQERALEIFADHLMIDVDNAQLLLNRMFASPAPKETLAVFIVGERPRWKAEADALIEKYGLDVKITTI
jgi:hypothetical protein